MENHAEHHERIQPQGHVHAAHGHRDGPGYETEDAGARPLIRFALALAVCVLICMGFLRWLQQNLREPDIRPPGTLPPANLYQQRDQLQKDELRSISDYSLDRKTGVAHIPIEKAMDLIVERGVPKGKGPRTERELNARGQPTVTPDMEAPGRDKKDEKNQKGEKDQGKGQKD